MSADSCRRSTAELSGRKTGSTASVLGGSSLIHRSESTISLGPECVPSSFTRWSDSSEVSWLTRAVPFSTSLTRSLMFLRHWFQKTRPRVVSAPASTGPRESASSSIMDDASVQRRCSRTFSPMAHSMSQTSPVEMRSSAWRSSNRSWTPARHARVPTTVKLSAGAGSTAPYMCATDGRTPKMRALSLLWYVGRIMNFSLWSPRRIRRHCFSLGYRCGTCRVPGQS